MIEDSSSQPCYVSALPVELLCKIFLLPLAECHNARPVIDDGSQYHPICISHVCLQWRAVALQTPALWAVLYVNPVTVHPDRLYAFLERSASHPLTISIYCNEPRRSHVKRLSNLYISLLSKLQPHASRWGALDIMSRNEELQDRILEFLQAMAAPALRKFRVVGDINVMADPPPLPFRGEMTQLEDLHLDGVQLSWPHCRFQKLKSLTLIREIEISFPALLAFLSSCPSIVNLTLDLSIVDRGNETQVVTMPALERFAFNVSIRSIRFIWNHIYLPKLHSLALDPVGSEYRPALKVLTSPHPAMPTSPLPSWSLTSLGLWPNTEVSGFTGALFHELPNVRVLFLCPNGPIASSTSINDLSMHSKSTYPPSANHDGPALVLPRLTTLILAEGQCSYEAVICVSWDLLQETVIRRRDAGVPLKKLFVEYENEWADEPPEEAAWLLENLDAVGMIPKTWKLQTMNMEYTEDWCAIEAEPAGTWAFERLCERLGFTLFKPNGGQPAATSDDCTEEY